MVVAHDELLLHCRKDELRIDLWKVYRLMRNAPLFDAAILGSSKPRGAPIS